MPSEQNPVDTVFRVIIFIFCCFIAGVIFENIAARISRIEKLLKLPPCTSAIIKTECPDAPK
jgi:hypothetical protein